MKEMFPGYFASDADSLNGLWKNCLFVLDANVLLNLYRYSNETSAELIDIFALLHNRVWVPHQVAKEYLGNRVAAITQQVKIYDDALKSLADLKKSFENPKQHPFISDNAMKNFSVSHDDLVEELRANKAGYLSMVEHDHIKNKLEVLFKGRVGNAFDENTTSLIIAAGQVRYSQRIPPGYKDAKKGGDSEILEEKLKPYGDFIVWKQTLEKAKNEKAAVIFVTGDSKEDWWSIYSGKPLEPHPQLIDEFVREVGQDFYMYLPEVFMNKANEYLGRVTSQRAVEEIVDVRKEEEAQENDIAILKSLNARHSISARGSLEALRAARADFELKLASIAVKITSVEADVSRILGEQDELVTRLGTSLEMTGQTNTPHSERLNVRVRDNASVLNVMQRDLVSLKNLQYSVMKELDEIHARANNLLYSEP
ncbi:PIN domain-containing protein [Pseudomonas yamanorum]|uniref:PIN domain-containing protein n=1 Tax=Pseudomonas yamanorum TaxID=515393 RepID=A0ABU1CR80_9PSED|nr:PIN-like domain-containing protein [Pseudomonas yamanorum]MDR0189776.1 PIN domain-containing protein [Pseudomonas yamanorum]